MDQTLAPTPVDPAKPTLSAGPFTETTLRDLYLDLVKRCLLGLVYEDKPIMRFDTRAFVFSFFTRRKFDYDSAARETGLDWPSQAHSMIGLERMNNLHSCVEQVLRDNVPGDLIETGVWRGGASIFMRAVLRAHDVRDRSVWVADSFEGLPPPNAEKYPQDKRVRLDKVSTLAVSLEDVKANFERYGLLDDQVKFLKGWFRDTLPGAPVERLAVLRLDGDLYESTTDALTSLYPKLTPGGFVIVDDYGAFKPCRDAVHDYRRAHGIEDPIETIDWSGSYWRKSG